MIRGAPRLGEGRTAIILHGGTPSPQPMCCAHRNSALRRTRPGARRPGAPARAGSSAGRRSAAAHFVRLCHDQSAFGCRPRAPNHRGVSSVQRARHNQRPCRHLRRYAMRHSIGPLSHLSHVARGARRAHPPPPAGGPMLPLIGRRECIAPYSHKLMWSTHPQWAKRVRWRPVRELSAASKCLGAAMR